MLRWETWSKGAEKGGQLPALKELTVWAMVYQHKGWPTQRGRPAAEFSVINHKSSSKVKNFTTKMMPCDYKSSCKSAINNWHQISSKIITILLRIALHFTYGPKEGTKTYSYEDSIYPWRCCATSRNQGLVYLTFKWVDRKPSNRAHPWHPVKVNSYKT